MHMLGARAQGWTAALPVAIALPTASDKPRPARSLRAALRRPATAATLLQALPHLRVRVEEAPPRPQEPAP